MKSTVTHTRILLAVMSLVLVGCMVYLTTTFTFAQTNTASVGEPVRVLVGFTDQPGQKDKELINKFGGKVNHAFTLVPAMAATVPEAALDGLRKNPRVTYVEIDGVLHATDIELDNTWGVEKIGAGAAHATGTTGGGVKVAVIDSGIDYTHPDLAANYAGGYDFVNKDADPMDDQGHGTHVAGTIAAVANGVGVVGVAPTAQIYALKVLSADNWAYWSDVTRALEWAVDHGIQVTNTSLGGDTGSETMRLAYENSNALGMFHAVSAGNQGICSDKKNNVGYPAKYDSVVAVAAVDSVDKRACWSSSGSEVDVAAPGVEINSTLWGGGYGLYNGTSMASPHVAGSAALLIAAGISDANLDGYVNDDVRRVLIETAVDLGQSGFDNSYGYGRIAVDAALASLTGGPVVPSEDSQVTVDSILYETVGGKAGDKDFVVTVAIKDLTGTAVSEAVLLADVMLDDMLFTSESAITDTAGNAVLTIRNAPVGCFKVVVTEVVVSSAVWVGTTPDNSYCK